MRKIINFIVAFAFVLIIVQAVPAQELDDKASRTLISKECGFSALFPAKPKLDTDLLDTKTTQKHYRYAYYVTDHTETYYEVMCMDLSPERLKGGAALNLKSYYEETIAPNAKKEIKKNDFKIPNGVGLEFYVENDDSYFKRGKMMIINNRLYKVSVDGNKSQTASAKTKQFIDSFKLTKEKL
jgi:hypothetical protein